MFRFKSYIALFLLLLFIRVLVPETTVLALHSHEHTEEHIDKDSEFKVGKKHQHCQVDQLFNSPFTPTPNTSVTKLEIVFTDTYSATHFYIWQFSFPNNTDLRGPPIV